MSILFKLALTLLLTGAFSMQVGIIVDTALDYRSNWRYVVNAGMALFGLGGFLALAEFLSFVWRL